MATIVGSQPKLPTGKGCFKCGKTGHWSRDCTAPPSEWVARAPTQPSADGTPGPAHAQSTEATQDPAPQLQVPVATGKRKRQKPKLTVDNLKERHGIAEVFHTFPKSFRQQFRGRGHEAGDLRRLLEMYIGWQQHIFPYAPFDAFIEGLEKLGSSYVLKMELRELRSEVLKVVDKPQQEGGWTGMGPGSSTMQEHDAANNEDDGMPEWDDDDLIAMQAEPMEPRNAPPATAPLQQKSAELELDDDELLDMMGDMQPDPHPQSMMPATMPPPVTDTLADDEFDDEELLELAQAGMGQDQRLSPPAANQPPHATSIPENTHAAVEDIRAGPSTSTSRPQELLAAGSHPAAAVPAANDDYLEMGDDELLELACASMDPQPDGADTAPTASKATMSPTADGPASRNKQGAQVVASDDAAGDQQGEDAAPVSAAANEYDLDDEELLALAATQLKGS